jgi:Cu/Ag efflux protein CusF
MKMANLVKSLLPALALAALANYAWAQQSGAPAYRSELTKVQATVQSIDPKTREVTIEGPKGPVTIAVGPEVKNFNNLKVGDKVNVSFYQGIGAEIVKGSQKVSDPAAAAFATPNAAGPGMTPGGVAGASATVTVKIEAIDLPTNTVAFKRSDGTTHIIEVKSPEMKQFIRTLKPGDHVNVTYTESVAVSIIPQA